MSGRLEGHIVSADVLVEAFQVVDKEDLAWYCASLSKRIEELTESEENFLNYPNYVLDRMNKATRNVQSAVEAAIKNARERN